MATTFSVYLLTLLCLLSDSVLAKETGALQQACASMTPGHYGTTAKTSPAPFSLTVDKSIYEEGDNITVTLRKTSAKQFKGFLIQARDKDQNIIPGFRIPSGSAAQMLPCSSDTGAVTHTDASLKEAMSFNFSAPDPKTGIITMYATVVESFDSYWVKIPSQSVVAVSGGPTISFSIPLLMTIILILCSRF